MLQNAKMKIVILVITLVLVWPISSSSAPAWKIRIVDENGKPVDHVVVRESCRNYSAEFHGHRDDQSPDREGYVTFSPKTIASPLIERILVLANSADEGVHAGHGPNCFVFAFADNLQSTTLDWSGTPSRLESTIIVKHSK